MIELEHAAAQRSSLLCLRHSIMTSYYLTKYKTIKYPRMRQSRGLQRNETTRQGEVSTRKGSILKDEVVGCHIPKTTTYFGI